MAEIREMETLYKTQRKMCVNHGYGKLDTLLENKLNFKPSNDQKKILIAPSWGAQGLLEKYAFQTIKPLIDAGFYVVVRPHPMTWKKAPDILLDLINVFEAYPNFQMEKNVLDNQSLLQSDLMISDWSGVALEFSFSMAKPVIFVDVEKKILNEDYKKLTMPKRRRKKI